MTLADIGALVVRGAYWLALVICAAIVGIASCTSPSKKPSDSSSFRVALLTPGPVSDAGWNAAAFDGLQLIKAQTRRRNRVGPDQIARRFRRRISRLRVAEIQFNFRAWLRVHGIRNWCGEGLSESLFRSQFGEPMVAQCSLADLQSRSGGVRRGRSCGRRHKDRNRRGDRGYRIAVDPADL